MAIPTEVIEHCSNTNTYNKTTTPRGLRPTRPRKNSHGDLSVDSCSTASLTDDSSSTSSSSPTTTPARRRRQRNRPRKNKSTGGSSNDNNNNTAETLSEQEKNRYVAMDCEMVGVGESGGESAVARVTLVNWDGAVLMDEYVRPEREVTDYRTFVSGITQEDLLLHATMTLTECRKMVLQLLEGKILVGHALKNDLQGLAIRHPWQDTRDTAKYEPLMKVRFEDGILWPRKLKELVAEKLSREIQLPGAPHCPYEDAVAAMDLYRKVRTKWEKVMDYKIKKTAAIEQSRQQQQQQIMVMSQAV